MDNRVLSANPRFASTVQRSLHLTFNSEWIMSCNYLALIIVCN